MNLDTATPLQRGLYSMCHELERLGASPFQTRLVMLCTDAYQEIDRLRQALGAVSMPSAVDPHAPERPPEQLRAHPLESSLYSAPLAAPAQEDEPPDA